MVCLYGVAGQSLYECVWCRPEFVWCLGVAGQSLYGVAGQSLYGVAGQSF